MALSATSPIAAAPRPSAGSRLARSAAVGLGVALAVVMLLAGWLQAGVGRDLDAAHQQREAVLVANAIAGSLDGATESAALGQRLAVWASELRSIERARVVAGRELLASTDARDEAPRNLQRDEKALFDLAAALRAAAETNAGEGAVRKKTIQVDAPRGGVVTVSVPYRVGGAIEGMVQVDLRPAASQAPEAGGWLLPLGLVAAAFAIGVLLRIDASRRFDVGRALALVALVAGAVTFQQVRLGQMEARIDASASAMSTLQSTAAGIVQRIGAALPAGDVSAWDTDAYGRPLGLLAGDGRLLAQADAARDSHIGFLVDGFWVVDAIGVLVLLFFVQGFAARTAAALREHAVAYAYVAPAMIGMLLLVFFPFFYGIALAFTDTTLFNEQTPFRERWIGLGNFFAILGDFDIVKTTAEGTVVNYQNFYWTLMMTVIWTVTNVTVGVTFGFLLALALNTEGFKGKTIYRVLLILPWAIPNYITALIWRGMFHPQFGVINQFLQMFGFEPVRWFDGVFSSFMTGLITNGWLSFPFMMVVILGALQSIPKDMYEAAEVEGASRWQQLRSITLPLLRPTLVPAIVLSVVWTFNMFNIIFLVSGGEPGGANEILITKAYKLAFEQYQYAYAAAYSTVIFVILLVYGYFQTRITRATESY
ncbi:MAG: sugar ABC transporter permease [Rubrivivax sp.]|jgi:arabinogalactan oligomer/maltooligosaccharide transport system permease protein|nr:sugar ABC transporter permease [Rubrivivax sp.]